MSKNVDQELPVWDLTDLYQSDDDPQIQKDSVQITQMAQQFSDKFAHKIKKGVEVNLLKEAFERQEQLSELLTKVLVYTGLRFAIDKDQPKVAKLYQNSRELASQIHSKILWFDLSLADLDDQTVQKLQQDTNFWWSYGYYIDRQRVLSPYTLQEKEEQILVEKDQSATQAWRRFYSQQFAREIFLFEGQEMNYEKIAAIFKDDPDRKRRQEAYKCISSTLDKNKDLYAYILNTLLLDKATVDSLRKLPTPQTATYLASDTPETVINSLIKVVVDNYDLPQQYYRAKKKILGYPELHEWDRYSWLYPDLHQTVTWSQATKQVLEGFYSFSKEIGQQVERFFDEGWIDAQVKPGKTSGAFCSLGSPHRHPHVLLNFTGELGQIMTLAHEIGHGLHALYASQQSYFHFYPSTPVAEVASTFSELLIFDKLLDSIDDNKYRQAFIGHKLEGLFAAIFRQIDFHLFESEIHQKRRQSGELSTQEISQLWQTQIQKMFGQELILSPAHQNGWIPVLHFFKYNFYVYSYAFAELLSLSLYEQYRQDRDGFSKRYLKLLQAGGSMSPSQMVKKTVGLDIQQPDFWQGGMKVIADYINQFSQSS